MSFEQAAIRLAGGFGRPIDDESLRAAIQAALPTTPMGELESIKALPGMVDAAADTLQKAWRAGIDLAAGASDHPRLNAIARLEAAVLDQLPSNMLRPVDFVAAAIARIGYASAVFGPMEIAGFTKLSPLLETVASGACGAHPGAMDGRAEEHSRMVRRYGRHDRARIGGNAAGFFDRWRTLPGGAVQFLGQERP